GVPWIRLSAVYMAAAPPPAPLALGVMPSGVMSMTKLLASRIATTSKVPAMVTPLNAAAPAVKKAEPCDRPWLARVTLPELDPFVVVNGFGPKAPLDSV